MTVTIRPASPRDLPALTAIKHEAGLAAWPHILPAEVIAALPFPDRWATAIGSTDPRVAVLVAETEGSVVGFAITRPSGDDDAAPRTGELDGFYSAPDVWGLGVGRALLSSAVAALAEAGFGDATLWTAVDNHRPRRIYEGAGWQADGATRDRSIGGTDFSELRYRLALRPNKVTISR